MAASPSVVPVALTTPVVPVLSGSSDFSNLREIKKQLLLIAGLTRERGLLHSSKWWDVGVGRDRTWILWLGGACGADSVLLVCFRSAELAFSLPALPLAELQPPPPITEVRTSSKRVLNDLSLEGSRADCLAGMFVEGIKAFKELVVVFVWLFGAWSCMLFYLCFCWALKDLVVLLLKLERISKRSLRFQPFKGL